MLDVGRAGDGHCLGSLGNTCSILGMCGSRRWIGGSSVSEVLRLDDLALHLLKVPLHVHDPTVCNVLPLRGDHPTLVPLLSTEVVAAARVTDSF